MNHDELMIELREIKGAERTNLLKRIGAGISGDDVGDLLGSFFSSRHRFDGSVTISLEARRQTGGILERIDLVPRNIEKSSTRAHPFSRPSASPSALFSPQASNPPLS